MANLRFLGGTEAQSLIGPGEPQPCPAFTVTGPTSRAARFRLQSGRCWGGWAAAGRLGGVVRGAGG
jgi:hypothetical protein